MDESEFTSAYTYTAEDGVKYIEFDGNIEILIEPDEDNDEDEYYTEKHEITAKVFFSDLDL